MLNKSTASIITPNVNKKSLFRSQSGQDVAEDTTIRNGLLERPFVMDLADQTVPQISLFVHTPAPNDRTHQPKAGQEHSKAFGFGNS
jgi:hypothetical protein